MFRDVAEECVEFENQVFSPSESNWADLRRSADSADAPLPCQWCHGAGGIGIARIGMFRNSPKSVDLLLRDIEAAVTCVSARWPDPLDTLCCGSLGNIEFLSEAAAVLGRDELRQMARERLVSLLESASGVGDFCLGVDTKRFNLGLFKGIGGVALTLLRQMDASIPNVLLWE